MDQAIYRREESLLHISRTTSTLIGAALMAASFAVTAGAAPVQHTRPAGVGAQASLDSRVVVALRATTRYATDLALAKRSGYRIITRSVPGTGYQFMNPAIKGFDARKPSILVYERRGQSWKLGAVEWVFADKPARPPLPGARYGRLGAGCHYTDGTFVPAENRTGCPRSAPRSRAAFSFWHPRLVTMRAWLWTANPNGLFAGANPAAGYENPLTAAYSTYRATA
jgi:hypothetical protein